MPFDRSATQTTATNNATYFVNKSSASFRDRRFASALIAAHRRMDALAVSSQSPCMKLLILIDGAGAAARPASFNHLVGAAEPQRRHGEAQRVGGFEIDYKLEL